MVLKNWIPRAFRVAVNNKEKKTIYWVLKNWIPRAFRVAVNNKEKKPIYWFTDPEAILRCIAERPHVTMGTRNGLTGTTRLTPAEERNGRCHGNPATRCQRSTSFTWEAMICQQSGGEQFLRT
ncbi:hypothetical protein NDU88_002358 [Pleurodeles waltl]|uniref:Uncharacterized protein n=1 Tax=Pleurodeles waltl TaxID=8319 RepID=A0AAV7P6J3_PLEWA|nr:hypothetical protein NDU88_002358 [Pleurodeles waltl]